jgi:heme exporter protein D
LAKHAGVYKSKKRRKEILRQKKQEEKRKRRLNKDTNTKNDTEMTEPKAE